MKIFISVQLLQFIVMSVYSLDEIDPDFPLDPPATTQVLPRDNRSGCICRIYNVNAYVSCYDPVECHRIPINTFNLTKLRITTTAIAKLMQNDFKTYTMIVKLKIDANSNLKHIDTGAFNGLSNLKMLTITSCPNLRYLTNSTFNGLHNIETLRLLNNGFVKFESFFKSFGMLYSLQNLTITGVIAGNSIKMKDFKELTNLHNLKTLNLLSCHLQTVENGVFSKLPTLKTLGLGQNLIDETSLIIIIKECLTLDAIFLDFQGFDSLPQKLLTAIGASNITSLDLSQNRFELIEIFPSMPNLKRLKLQDVSSMSIADGAFSNLQNLEYLNIARNKFPEIPQAALAVPSLQYLDVSYLSGLLIVEEKLFRNMTNLLELNLSGNSIRKISENMFIGLSKLEVLNLTNCRIYFIDELSFQALKKLRVLLLDHNTFGSSDIEKGAFFGLNRLKQLGLSDTQITDSFLKNIVYLPNVEILDLSMNNITTLSNLQYLTNLKVLDLSKNSLTKWNNTQFPNLKKLDISFNGITTLTDAMLTDFNNVNDLKINNNQIVCDCTIANQNKLKHNIFCTIPNMTLFDYMMTNQCSFNLLVITAVVVILFLSLTFTSIVLCLYRKNIKYYMFLLKIYMSSNRTVNTNTNAYVYDAFISYASEDNLIVSKLVSRLEPKYKLCVYERDFEIGSVISESVLNAVLKSRKILLVISENFIRSQWCRWEAQIAQNKRIFFTSDMYPNNSVIILRLGKFNEDSLSPLLKYLLTTLIYLEWNEDCPNFWKKINKALERGERICAKQIKYIY